MPGKVKVKIVSGRNLPVMDRSSDTTDAYVEIKLGNTTFKTDVCRKSLNPQWNSEWYRFEVDDSELQDEPLQIRLMDHDTYSANDAIGKVYLDLNPLLLPTAPAPVRNVWTNDNAGSTTCCTSSGGGSVMSGWIPVYDTMHGIRGEVNVIVKVELFSDFNKFRQSSCGVQFFCSPVIPQGFHAQVIHGFVEELVVNDDPEYQWIDKIRTPRASNEARQTLFFKLSGEIQRKIGLKALDLGGNAVIGYCQNFDLEGESGIVARGIGTAVTLTRIQDSVSQVETNLISEPPLVAALSSSMLANLTANGTNLVAPLSPRIHSPLPFVDNAEEPPLMGKRFPGVGIKPKPRKKKRNVTLVHQEVRSQSLGRNVEMKRGRSTQSLSNDSDDGRGRYLLRHDQRAGNRITRGLRAIRMLHKNVLLKKIPKLRNKWNSDSSTVEGDDSEVDSSSDWSQRETRSDLKGKYHRTQSDSTWYGLDRVLEVKETTQTPPATPKRDVEPVKMFEVFNEEDDRPEFLYKDGHLEYAKSSTSSDSSSSEDSSRVLPTIRHVNTRRKSFSKSKPDATKKKDLELTTNRKQTNLKKKRNKKKNSKSEADVKGRPGGKEGNGGHRAAEHDVACPPQINIICYDADANACSLSAPLMSPIHKSKSATALIDYPSHECESALSSALIAPDYKEHGPCLIPPSRNDDAERTSSSGTPGLPGSTGPTGLMGHPMNPAIPANPQVTAVVRASQSPAKVSSVPSIHRRSSDSDLSITPKGNSLTGSDRSSGMRDGHSRQTSSLVRPSMNQESLDMLEYPFLTMSKYPSGFIQHLGGTVSARSVKLLERITNLEEPETRDAWWTELRMEVRCHARAMGCNVVVGYSENTSICDDVCVLSASGTAALINLNAQSSENDVFTPQHPATRTAQVQNQGKEMMTASLDRCDFEKDAKRSGDTSLPPVLNAPSKARHTLDSSQDGDYTSCTVCHIPYSESSVPFRVNMQKCGICRRGKVPDVLFTTIDLIDNLPTGGKGCFIHAYVCRAKRDCKGEMNAKEISDGLPFLEYELHRLLINKLKVRGMNTIFGLKVQVSIGEKMLIGLATGTAALLTALPTPPIPKVSAGNSWKDNRKLTEMQKQLQETVKKNRDFYQLKSVVDGESHVNGRHVSEDTDESDDDLPDLDLSLGNKDTCILEVDDAEDADVIALLIDPRPPDGFHVVNTETVPGLDDLEVVKNLQMFTQVWRAKIPIGQPLTAFNQHFNRLLQSVFFKLRNLVPCALSDLQFKIILEQDEIQLSLLGMALGLGESDLNKKKRLKNRLLPSLSRETVKKLDEPDLIFNLEEDTTVQTKTRSKSPVRTRNHKHTPPRSRYGVDITPLSYVPGGKIERYLGNLNFFFIRESTCIREGGGLSGFLHSFITEVLAIVRAHVTALGGNAMVAYFMSECFLYHYPHKNQGQCLINVGGDVVYVSYFAED